MTSLPKLGPNDACPCWSGKKYKRCCRGKVDWPAILRSGTDHRRFLSIRGRNLLFFEAIGEALQLDRIDPPISMPTFKKAFTATAVRKIHEAIVELWPLDTDIQSVLEKSSDDVSGLYIGDYGFDYLMRAVVRHSMYANRILLVDPFVHPHITADKFNPILHPEQHRAQTLRNVNTYISFLPWIDAGMVEFIRTPADFDRRLNWEAMTRASALKTDPEMRAKLEESVAELKRRYDKREAAHQLFLSTPDSHLKRKFRELNLDADDFSEDDLIEYVNSLRDQDPNFLEPLGSGQEAGQLHMFSTGGTYEIAKLSAQMSASYLFTDLGVRWKLITDDRKHHSAEVKTWSPFAKAVQGVKLHYLNNMRLEHALSLRQENRLAGVRGVLMKAWSKEKTDDPFDETRAELLGVELEDAVRAAEGEWADIKKGLWRFGAGGLATGLLSAGPLVAAGHAMWLAGAAVVGAIGLVASSVVQKRASLTRHPAAFFMDLKSAE